MDENAKKVLYRQLLEMHSNNVNEATIITEEEFLGLEAKEALKYILDYRKAANFGRYIDNGDRRIYYLELPDMDLSEQDLHGVYLCKFIPGIRDENGNVRPSTVNLENTNATINVTDIGYNASEVNENGITDYVIDFEKMNFKGCNVYGILPDEYSEYNEGAKSRLKTKVITKNKEEHLDTIYLKRREEKHLSKEAKKIADRAYSRIMQGKSVKGMVGVHEGIDFTDYDFRNLTDEQRRAFTNSVLHYNIEMKYADFSTREVRAVDWYLSDDDSNKISRLMPRAIEEDDKDFILEYITYVPEEKREKIVNEAIKNGNIRFFNRYWYDIQIIPKEKKKEIIDEAIKNGNIEFLDKHWYDIPEEKREKVVNEAIKNNNIDFLDRKLKWISKNQKEKIINEVIKNGNIEFLDKHWDDIPEEKKKDVVNEAIKNYNIKFLDRRWYVVPEEKKEEIINEVYARGDFEFIEKHWYFILKEKRKEIINDAYTRGDFELVEKHWDDLPEQIQVKLITEAYNKGDFTYIEKHWNEYLIEINEKILINAYKKGKSKFINKLWEEIPDEIKEKLLNDAIENENVTFIKNIFDKLPKRKQHELSIFIYAGILEITLPEMIDIVKYFKKLGGNFFDYCHVKDVELLQEIITSIGCEKPIIKENYNILLMSPQMLYARLMFFKENDIKIDSKNFMRTLGLTHQGFEEHFGSLILKKYRSTINYSNMLKRALLNKYPMPKTKEELRKELKKVNEKYKEREGK